MGPGASTDGNGVVLFVTAVVGYPVYIYGTRLCFSTPARQRVWFPLWHQITTAVDRNVRYPKVPQNLKIPSWSRLVRRMLRSENLACFLGTILCGVA